MKSQVEKFLPAALEAVNRHFMTDDQGQPREKIPKQFKGYISSFGAAVIQTGLLPAVAFYSVRGSAEEERGRVIEAIFYVLRENDIVANYNNLMQFLVANRQRLDYFKPKIMDAATALKLALRTFPIEKQD